MADAYRRNATGLTLSVRVTPKARHTAIEGMHDGPDGPMLAIAVNAPPEDGKANAAVIELLAKALGLPKSAVAVAQGGKNRRKTVTIDGPPDHLSAKLDLLIAGDPHG